MRLRAPPISIFCAFAEATTVAPEEPGCPYVAIGSSVFVLDLPVPNSMETALRMEEIVRADGVIPRTAGMLQAAGRQQIDVM
jgi:pseudouridine-5'-phosphate glycosidase